MAPSFTRRTFTTRRIAVWDSKFAPASLAAGAFTDPSIPAGFGPFGIQAIGGNLYVTYAKQDADRHDDVKGQGLGFVDVFDPNGNLLRRVATRGKLNAPWGLALAPAGFGELGDTLLVGNFGDGRINAFDLGAGELISQLKGADGKPVVIDGLWGLAFGNGFAQQPVNTLFFTAGPDDEAHGLYGRLDLLSAPGSRSRRRLRLFTLVLAPNAVAASVEPNARCTAACVMATHRPLRLLTTVLRFTPCEPCHRHVGRRNAVLRRPNGVCSYPASPGKRDSSARRAT